MTRSELETEIELLEEEICELGSSIYDMEQRKYRLEMTLENARKDLAYLSDE